MSHNGWFNSNHNAKTIVGEFSLYYYTPRQKDYYGITC
jgi:hypothetical protein